MLVWFLPLLCFLVARIPAVLLRATFKLCCLRCRSKKTKELVSPQLIAELGINPFQTLLKSELEKQQADEKIAVDSAKAALVSQQAASSTSASSGPSSMPVGTQVGAGDSSAAAAPVMTSPFEELTVKGILYVPGNASALLKFDTDTTAFVKVGTLIPDKNVQVVAIGQNTVTLKSFDGFGTRTILLQGIRSFVAKEDTGANALLKTIETPANVAASVGRADVKFDSSVSALTKQLQAKFDNASFTQGVPQDAPVKASTNKVTPKKVAINKPIASNNDPIAALSLAEFEQFANHTTGAR